MTLMDVALESAGRGWHVFPCKPRTKQPATANGFKAATIDEAKIREWWERWPDANVGISTGPSGLCVLDIDHGINDADHLAKVMEAHGLPDTYVVRTGRRPEFGAQLYYIGTNLKSVAWTDDNGDISGDIRCATGYVMAAGSIHPSGEVYERLGDFLVEFVPEYVRTLKPERGAGIVDDGGPIIISRNNTLTSIAGHLRNAGLGATKIERDLLEINAERCQPPLDDEEVLRIARNAAAWKLPEVEPEIILGRKIEEPKAPLDWRTRYATSEQFRDVQPPSFLIRNFLEDGSITAIGAPVAQRKSIVVANVIHALLTGEPLFGHFEVVKRPERVIYLCPEMGLVDIANRFKKLGMQPYVGKSLFIRTMDDTKLSLTELDEELPGALLILDTITRFVAGNQNDAGDMAKFADINYAIKRRGATLLLLHHAVKGTAGNMTLDSALRGSTELAAFVTCVWSTQLQDPDAPHTTPSNLKCVKQRGFASEPFQVSCDAQFRMTMLGTMGEIKTQKQASSEAALAGILKESPSLGVNKLQAALREVGHRRGAKWITAARAAIVGGGVILSSQPISKPIFSIDKL